MPAVDPDILVWARETAGHEGNQDVAIYLGGGRAEEAGR